MSSKKTKYKTISCSFYDVLLEKATLKEIVDIKYMELNGESLCSGIIVDVFTKNKGEFLKLDSRKTIRLDKLISVNNQHLSNFTNCTY